MSNFHFPICISSIKFLKTCINPINFVSLQTNLIGLCIHIHSSLNSARKRPYIRREDWINIYPICSECFARIEYIPPIKKKEPVKIAVVWIVDTLLFDFLIQINRLRKLGLPVYSSIWDTCIFSKNLSVLNKFRKSRFASIFLEDLRKMSIFAALKSPFYGMDFRKRKILRFCSNRLRRIWVS